MERFRTDELLLSFLRAETGGAGAAGSGELSEGDWEDLLYASERHHVAPALYRLLIESREGMAVPAEVIRSLRNGYLQSAARNAHLYHELGKVLERLRRSDIRVIALKGAHLAEAVYRNIALRPMGDLDLLVRTADIGRAEEALLGMGYLPVECNRRIAEDNYHFSYRPAGREPVVELHWRFTPSMQRLNIDMEGVWERSEPARLAGVELSVLCPEDQLSYLCLHASKHLFEGMRLKLLYDISMSVRHYGDGLDWNGLGDRIEEWGIEKCAYVALTLAAELLGVSVPKCLMTSLNPVDLDERVMELGMEQLFACGRRRPEGSRMSPNIARLFGGTGRKGRVPLFLRRAFPSAVEMSRWYPPPPDSMRIYFYYPARILDLLRRYGSQCRRLLRRESAMTGAARRENEIALWSDWLSPPSGM